MSAVAWGGGVNGQLIRTVVGALAGDVGEGLLGAGRVVDLAEAGVDGGHSAGSDADNGNDGEDDSVFVVRHTQWGSRSPASSQVRPSPPSQPPPPPPLGVLHDLESSDHE